MPDTLININDSNLPAAPPASTPKADIDRVIEKWEPIIKRKTTSLVLTEKQQEHSINARPYITILFTILQVYLTWKYNFRYGDKRNAELAFIRFVETMIVNIFIGIPTEVAQGSTTLFVFYMVAFAYPQIVVRMVLDDFWLRDNPIGFALAGLHLINIIRNWSTFPYKYAQILFLFALTLPIEFMDVYESVKRYDSIWRTQLVDQTILFSGLFAGILLGFFWIYRNKEEDKPETAWKNYTIILSILTIYLLINEFSGIHLKYQEITVLRFGK
ncbi:unnamed protein product [Caenorhabditis angaria]|uniref:Uncharacterized protein n=1 Tax=Caenorhabditis angaria TaxID=860376 RepID=A0A9P1N190_9PELO|nr:unnamed protein product [Caenorhabditis angaria]